MSELFNPHHRDVSGGALRAAVFGMSDGLVSNVALVLGVAGANSTQGAVQLAGIAGLVAGACSMAAGEYISMQAQREVLEYELRREKTELAHRPDFEKAELAAIYQARGISKDLSERLSEEVMRDPDVALEIHAREELGINPHSLGSPFMAAASSFLTFTLGALIPLIPWFFGSGNAAIAASLIAAGVAAILLGGSIGVVGGRSVFRSGLRQLVVAGLAAAVTFGIGNLVGTGVIE